MLTPANMPEKAQRASGAEPLKSRIGGVIDSVADQHGGRWVRYGTEERSIWLSLHEIHVDSRAVFARLSETGMTFLTRSSQDRFKKQIEDCASESRPALVASHSGWIDGCFVHGDGEVVLPPGDEREVIVTLDEDPKFTPVGSLDGWQAAVGPVVSDQPLLLFAIAYALVPPLLRFAPAHVQNPFVELVGDFGSGKTTVGTLAASVWAGNPDSDVGGGEKWDQTVNAIDPVKRRHASSLLMLDEGNLMGSSRQEERDLAERAVFKLTSTAPKRRKGDIGPVDHVRLATLSTTNSPLSELAALPAARRDALQSRIVTIRADGPHGALDSVPQGFASSRAAIEHLRVAVDQHYAVAGREFIKRLVKLAARHGEAKVRGFVQREMDNYLAWVGGADDRGSARSQKVFALSHVAVLLASRMGIIPTDWGDLPRAIREVHRSVIAGSKQRHGSQQQNVSAFTRITEYVNHHRSRLRGVDTLRRPLEKDAFESAAGFLRQRNGRSELLIPSSQFHAEFNDYRSMMQELREAGSATTERGRTPKLSIKAPSAICATGRVYCIALDATGSVR